MQHTSPSKQMTGVNFLSGLKVITNFISPKEEKELIGMVNDQEWNKSLRRLTQHYGYKYNYRSRSITKSDHIGSLPNWLDPLIDKILKTGLIKENPDQAIINRYLPGEGISAHIDAPHLFKDQVYSIGLGSPCDFVFSRGTKKEYLYLERRTFLLMEGDARYKYKHAIEPVVYDDVDDEEIKRGIRYSITFRNMRL